MTRAEFNMNRAVLSAAVNAMAAHITKHSHVIYVPTAEEAPVTMDAICKAWREALDSTGEFKVWSGGSTDTIYDSHQY
jgi:hypothetical protein